MTKMFKSYYAAAGSVLLFLAGISGFSQVNDAGFWIGLKLEKKVTPRFSINLEDEVRLNENMTEAGRHFTEIGGDYKLGKGFSTGMYYRFAQKRRLDDSYSVRHRIYYELSYRKRIDKFSLTVRERLQCQYADIHSSEKGHIPEYYLRSKISVKYRVKKKIQPFVYSELFYQLSNPEGNVLDKLRFAGGVEYTVKKIGSFEFYYLIDKEIQQANPLTQYVIGLGYTYSF